MLRTLAIRQAFFAIDLLLALGVAFVAFVFTTEAFEKETDRGARAVTADYAGPELAKSLGPRSAYQDVVTSGIFGGAGTSKRVEPAEAPKPKQQALEETRLSVTLAATVPTRGEPRDPLATASIRDGRTQQPLVFSPGETLDKISPDYELLEVHKRHVILWNARAKQSELLSMDDETAEMVKARANRRPQQAAGGVVLSQDEDSFVVDRQALEKTLSEKQDELMAAAPRPVRDEGRIVGFTSDKFEDVELAKELGLRDGDIIQEVNGVKLDSMDSPMKVVTRFQRAPVFRVSVKRDGKARMLTYRLQ
jgi:general secretion pathway protein C